jgi:branched-chain amino acid transport system permease protein
MLQRLRSPFRGRIFGLAPLDLVGLLLVAVVVVDLIPRVADRGLGYFVEILVFGIALGAIYALIALGYTMVYGIVELINFAHGDVFTLGAFISLPLLPMFGLVEDQSHGIGLILGLIPVFLITMALCAFVNVIIERVAYRPLRNAPRLAPLITAIGMSSILEGAMFLWRGPFTLHYPDLLPANQIQIGGGATISAKAVIIVGIAIVLVLALTTFINGSKLGKAMRATAQDRDAAQLMGININSTIAATFFIGAALAGAGGIIFGLYEGSVGAFLGFTAGLYAFTAAVFGGIGNIPGAALGGLLIGMISQLSDGYIDPAWTQVIIFAILILVLVFRPSGLLGMRVPEK